MPFLRRLLTVRPLTVGLAAVALAFAWQVLTVRYNYGANWTGLFCTGANQNVPRPLTGEEIFALPNSFGYDGQFYHYIAHDPLGRSRLPDYIDAPRMRFTRILVPGLAYILAAGQPRFIDAAYFAVILLSLFLGAFWLARLAELQGQPAAWGLLFLVFPASAVSIDRMTVDVALAALWLAFAAAWKLGRERWMLPVLVLAPLVRETGVLLVAAYCLWLISRRAWRRAGVTAAAVTPFVAWNLYVWAKFPPYHAGWLVTSPVRGVSAAAAYLISSLSMTAVSGLAASLNLVAVAGTLTAVALAFRFGVRLPEGMLEAGLALYGTLGVLMAAFGSLDIWVHVYGHARLLTPLFVLLAWRALARRTWTDLAPLALVTPAVGLQLAGDAWRIARGVVSGVLG